MKKIVSVFIAFVMMFSTMCVCAVPALASEQWEPRPYAQDTLGCVNGEPGDIFSDYNASLKEITYSYNGDGTVTDWELPLLKEGEDFEIVSKEANTFTIKKLDDEVVIPYVNAVVDFQQNEIISDNTDVTASLNNSETENDSVSKDTKALDTVNADETLTATVQNLNKMDVKDIALICMAVVSVVCISMVIFKKKK
ncbi:MAG: hypothetical protein K2F65_05150 [Eubacterium sp.]|nr:hypothetical protein [Eubacterium sp.]